MGEKESLKKSCCLVVSFFKKNSVQVNLHLSLKTEKERERNVLWRTGGKG